MTPPDFGNIFNKVKSATKQAADQTSTLARIAKLKANVLSLNLTKTNYIVFHFRQKKPPPDNLSILIDGSPIDQVCSTKFLGTVIDSNLSWKYHILQISKKVAKNIGILRRIKYLLPVHILITLYYTLIFPYLSYCNISWDVNYKNSLQHLISLQKRAIRTIFNVHWSLRTTEFFTSNKILTLGDINKLQIGLFMYRYYNEMLPPSFNNYFIQGSSIHHHFTRSAHHYRPDFARIKTKWFSIKCQGPALWNTLPKKITSLPSIGLFKKSLKEHLLSAT